MGLLSSVVKIAGRHLRHYLSSPLFLSVLLFQILFVVYKSLGKLQEFLFGQSETFLEIHLFSYLFYCTYIQFLYMGCSYISVDS